MQLRNRQRQIPNGYFFYEPQTRWKSSPGSFDNIVQQIIAHRRANPWLNKSTDGNAVANELDQFSSKLCESMGWTDFIIGGDPPAPFFQPLPLGQRLANVAAGGEVLVEFVDSKEQAVRPELAAARAAVCAKCPMNGRGDFLRFFTVPVAAALRKQLERKSDWKLETPHDNELGVCNACDCPMKLKVWIPVKRIREVLKPEIQARLHPDCWIPKET